MRILLADDGPVNIANPLQNGGQVLLPGDGFNVRRALPQQPGDARDELLLLFNKWFWGRWGPSLQPADIYHPDTLPCDHNIGGELAGRFRKACGRERPVIEQDSGARFLRILKAWWDQLHRFFQHLVDTLNRFHAEARYGI